MKPRLSLVGVLCLLANVTSAADWNQWRGAGRDGVAKNSPSLFTSLPAEGLKPTWIAQDELTNAKGGGWSSPVIANGKVYLFTHKRIQVGKEKAPKKQFPWLPPDKRTGMSDEEYQEYERKRRDEDEALAKFYRFDEKTYCLNAETGKIEWTNNRESVYTRFPQSGSPAVIDGKLYVLGAGRVARCIDATSGKDVWNSKLPGEFRDEMLQSSFAVADGVAVVLATELFGLDTATGDVLWKTKEEQSRSIHTSPVVWKNEGRSYFICNLPTSETVCIEPKAGEEIWREKTMGGNSTPLIVGDLLLTYGSSRKAGLRCFRLSEKSAEHLWTCQRTADPGSSPVVVNGHVYVQGERRLACVSLVDGRSTWMTDLDLNRPRYTSLVAADNKVVYAHEGILCFAANADDFTQLINAKIDSEGLMAEEAAFRKMLNMDELEKTAEGQKEAERLWRKTFNSAGPLACATPAIVDGRVFIRLQNGIACYDLRAASDVPSE